MGILMEQVTDIFLKRLIDITSQNPSQCYQCGKCSAGCPVRDFLETPPNRIVRFVQLGLYELALTSASIWLCAGCLTCTSRCPKNFDLAKFMDALRQIAVQDKIEPADKKVFKFHKAFMNQVKKHGRSYELGLIRDYKLSTGDFLQDIDAAPSAFMKGKISITPHNIKDKEKIKKIINKAAESDSP